MILSRMFRALCCCSNRSHSDQSSDLRERSDRTEQGSDHHEKSDHNDHDESGDREQIDHKQVDCGVLSEHVELSNHSDHQQCANKDDVDHNDITTHEKRDSGDLSKREPNCNLEQTDHDDSEQTDSDELDDSIHVHGSDLEINDCVDHGEDEHGYTGWFPSNRESAVCVHVCTRKLLIFQILLREK